MESSARFPALGIVAILASAAPLTAQAQPVDQLRSEVHQRLVAGHSPIGYSQTDEAMAVIHAEPSAPGQLILFYTGRSQDVGDWVNSNPQNGWNREHLWPQSRGTRGFPMKSDLHHLMPTDASVNQNRGNLNFDDGGGPEGEAPDTFLDGDSFEPRDAIKGDVARAIFYMDLRYEGTNGEPDLELVDATTPSVGTTIGDLCTLLGWHEGDLVSLEEQERNDRTEAEQGNRNAFIDEPTLAGRIYGHVCGDDLAEDGTGDDALRIGTWNIANLHHESGVPLRSGSVARDDEDYDRLAAVADQLDLDITALQEVGSPRAAARIFPETDYHIVMSGRYRSGHEDRAERDIYTAFVFSKEAFPEAPPTSTLKALSLQHVALDRDGTPSSRPTRAGVIAELTIGGEQVKLLGVHLKSSCHRWSLAPVVDQHPSTQRPLSSRFDCRTLWAQLAILENWIEQQAAQGIVTIVLGDFNREMNARDNQQRPIDHFWLDLNDGTPGALRLEKGPLGRDDVCWPQHPERFDDHIDLIVYDATLADLASLGSPEKVSMGFEAEPKYDGTERQRLSDHCPVVMTVGE